MTPFPTTHELFSVGWGKPDLREQWKQASPQAREQLLKQTNSRPYQPDPERTHTPASGFGAEWYGTAGDICRVHAALQAAAVGEAVPVKKILSAIPGIDLDPAKWSYIGAKGGNLPVTSLSAGTPLTHRPALGRQLPAQLAELSQSHRRGLAAVNRAPNLRPGADGLTQIVDRSVQA
jgi:beta-lactamase class A